MSKDFQINIDLQGFDDFARACRKAPKRLDSLIKKELIRTALQTEKYARDLSPYDTGHLENSISADNVVSKVGNTYIVYVGTNVEYAKYVHELFGRGERTRMKSRVKGYEPGRKFLRNAIILTESHLEHAMTKVLNQVLGEV